MQNTNYTNHNIDKSESQSARHRKRSKVLLGGYTPEGYCVRLSEDTPLLTRPTTDLVFERTLNFATFVHEYWHYLINISTPSRARDVMVSNDLLALFSKTIQGKANGISEGDAALTSEERSRYSEYVRMIDAFQGDGDLEERTGLCYTNFEVKNVINITSNLTLRGIALPIRQVTLDLECLASSSIWTTEKYRLGILAIEESLASEIDQMISPNTPPVFPYGVVRKLAEYYGMRNATNYEIAALSTLSLLSSDPPASLLTILQEYRASRRYENDDSILDDLWNAFKPQYKDFVNRIIDDELANLCEMHRGRGIMEFAIEYIVGRMTQCLRMRIDNPLFDVRIIRESLTDITRFGDLWTQVPQPYAIQEEKASNPDIPEKDQVIQFETLRFERLHPGYTPAFALFILNCQMDYVYSHATETGFRASATVPSGECPYYSLCTHQNRKDNPDWCKESPWLQHTRDEPNACWYAGAVAATLGGVELERM